MATFEEIETHSLQVAFDALYNTTADDLWRLVNHELAKRLNKEDYQQLINRDKQL